MVSYLIVSTKAAHERLQLRKQFCGAAATLVQLRVAYRTIAGIRLGFEDRCTVPIEARAIGLLFLRLRNRHGQIMEVVIN